MTDLVVALRIDADGKRAAGEVRRVSGSVKDLDDESKRASREITQSFRNAARGTAALREDVSRTDRAMSGLRRTVVGAVAAFASISVAKQALGDAVENARAFQRSMGEVSTLLDDTSGIDRLSNSVKGLTIQFGASGTREEAKALYQVISAGADASAEAVGRLTAANKLAVGGVSDVATSVDALDTVLNAYGNRVSGVTDVSDTLFAGVKVGVTTIDQLGSSIGKVVPLAATARIPFSELTATISTLTTQGLATSEAVTGMRGALSAILKPTTDAQKAAKQLGIDFSLTALRSKGFVEFMREIKEKAQGNDQILSKLFGDIEGLNAIFALTSGAGAAKLNEALALMARRAGLTEQAYEKMRDTPDFELKQLGAAVHVVSTNLGEAITQGEGFRSTVRGLTKELSGLDVEDLRKTLSAVGDVLEVVIVLVGARMVAALTKQAAAVTIANTAWIRYDLTLASAQGVSRAVAAGQIAMGAAARGAGAAVGLLGGPIGVATVAAWGLYEVVGKVNERERELRDLSPEMKQSFQTAMKGMGLTAKEQATAIQTNIGNIQSKIEAAQKQIDELRAKRAARGLSPDLPAFVVGDTEAAKIDQQIEVLNAHIAKMNDLIDQGSAKLDVIRGTDVFSRLASGVRPAIEAFNEMMGVATDTGDAIDAAKQVVDDYVTSTTQATESLHEQSLRAEKGAAAVARAKLDEAVATAKAAGATSEQIAQMREAGQAYVKAVEESEALKKAKQGETKTLREETSLLRDIAEARAGLVEKDDARLAITIRYAERERELLQQLDDEGANTALLTERIHLLREEREAELEQVSKRLSAGEQIVDNLDREIAILHANGIEREAISLTWGLDQKEFEKHYPAIVARLREKEIAEAGRDQAREYQGYWRNAIGSVSRAFGDFLTGGIKSFKDFGHSLLDIGRRLVSDLIAMFARQRIVIPIAMALFGGSNAYAAGLPGGAGGFNGLTTVASALFSGGGYGSGAYNASAFESYGVLNTPTGTAAGYYGPSGTVGAGGPYGWAGAALGAYYGFRSGGDTPGRLAGGLSGGLGGYALGSAASAGLSVLSAGGSFAGAGSAALGAIGPVGWAALGALALNSLTGGGLFGTSWKTNQRARTLSFDASGATGQYEFEQSKKKSFFRGTSHRTITEDLDAETQQAIQAFFDSLTESVRSASEQLGVDMPQIISGTLRQELDKQGNITGSTATIAGREYTDISQEEFQSRLVSENIIAVVSQANAAADAIANRWRADAEELAQGAQLLLQVQQQIQEGNALLEGDHALRKIVDLVGDLQVNGETMTQTYQRLSAETEQLRDALDMMGMAWSGTSEELVRQADAITKAAGGLQRAGELWSAYFNAFYSASERLRAQIRVARTAAGSELADVGLGIGVSREAFRSAFESAMADPGLAAEAKAQWLEAAAALGKVLDLEAQRTAQLEDFSRGLEDTLADLILSQFQQDMRDIATSFQDAMDKWRELGGTTEQATQIQTIAAIRMQRAIDALEERTHDLVAKLFGTPLDELNKQIDHWQQIMQQGSAETLIVAQHILNGPDGLIAQREKILAQQRAAERLGLGRDLAQNIADIAGVRGTTDFSALADEFGFKLEDLAQVLGIDQARMADYLESLQAEKYTLVDLTNSLDDMLKPHVDRIVNAIDGDGGQNLTKPLPADGGDGGGKAAADYAGTSGDVIVAPTPVTIVDRTPATGDQTKPAQAATNRLAEQLQDLNVELRNSFGRTGSGTRLHPESTREVERLLRDLIRAVGRLGNSSRVDPHK